MTETPSNYQPDPLSHPPYEEEIRLIDLFRIIWKWKWLIIGGTLTCAVVAAVISLQMPKIYEVSAIIEPGIAGIRNDGSFSYIDSPKNISGKIAEGIYSKKVEEALQLKTSVDFKAVIIEGTNAVKIVSRWDEADTRRGIEATSRLVRMLAEEHAETVAVLRSEFDYQIEAKLNDIQEAQQNTSLQDDILSKARKLQNKLLTQMEEVRRNNEKVAELIDSLLKDSPGNTETLPGLYSIIANQGVSYQGSLNAQYHALEVETQKTIAQKNHLIMKIQNIEGVIESLKRKQKAIRNIVIIQEPAVSPNPVTSGTKMIVFFIGFASLFVFVFIAFFIEYMKNAIKDT